jgi:Skp family chaperone for outer membrane proteins
MSSLFKTIAQTLALTAALGATPAVSAQELKIGYVNGERVLREQRFQYCDLLDVDP